MSAPTTSLPSTLGFQPEGNTRPQSLLSQTLDTLDYDTRSTLESRSGNSFLAVTDTLHLARRKRELCIRTRQKVKGVIIRDVVERIIHWLEKFQNLSAAADRYDSRSASFAWASVGHLLNETPSTKNTHVAMLEALEKVSCCIVRGASSEELHLEHDSPDSTKLRRLLVELYTGGLELLAKTTKIMLARPEDSLVEVQLQNQAALISEHLTTKEAEVSTIVSLIDLKARRDVYRGPPTIRDYHLAFDKRVSRRTGCLNLGMLSAMENDSQGLLRWLSEIPCLSHHEWFEYDYIPELGSWLLNHSTYLDWWNSSQSCFLLLQGTTGSGKSFLTFTVFDSFWRKYQNTIPLACFYCARSTSEPERSDPAAILRAIVKQLCTSEHQDGSVMTAIEAEYDYRKCRTHPDELDVSRLSIDDCVKFVLDLTTSYPAIIAIDALNELQESDRIQLTDAITRIVTDSENVVKIFATCRDDISVDTIMSGNSNLRVHAGKQQVTKHMKTFVDFFVANAINVGKVLDGVVSEKFESYLKANLSRYAGESFRLVNAQVNRFCGLSEERDIRESMRNFPSNNLNQIYSEIWQDIFPDGASSNQVATYAFSLLLSMRESLMDNTFLEALSFAYPDDSLEHRLSLSDLHKMTFGFTDSDFYFDVVRLTNPSVRDFIQQQTHQSFEVKQVNEVMARCCVKRLQSTAPAFPEMYHKFLTSNFRRYAILYWPVHCAAAEGSQSSTNVSSDASDFVWVEGERLLEINTFPDDTQEIISALDSHHPLKKQWQELGNSPYPLFFTACAFGIMGVVARTFENGDFDCNSTNNRGTTGLYLSAAFGHTDIVNMLLKHGANVHATGGRHGTALQAACFEGHERVVQLLLDYGADPYQRAAFESALHASIVGHNENVALYLLRDGYAIANQETYDSALQQTAKFGHVEAAKVLQSVYDQDFGNSQSRCMAIVCAIAHGHLGILKNLLSKSQNGLRELPRDAVSIASIKSHNEDMISFLLDSELSIEQEGQYGNPLWVASLKGNYSNVRKLLECGANPNSKTPFGTALHAAAMKGHVSVARSLINHGANVNARSENYETPLQVAAHAGHYAVTELLLDTGAAIYLQGQLDSPIVAAVSNDHKDVFELLLRRGICFKPIRDCGPGCRLPGLFPFKSYDDPLQIACEEAEGPIGTPLSFHDSSKARTCGSMRKTDLKNVLSSDEISFLTSHDHMVTARHEPGRQDVDAYGLRAAVAHDRVSFVKYLLPRWHSWGAPAADLRAAILDAFSSDNEEMRQEFLDCGLDLRPHLLDAMEHAARRGCLAGLEQLIARWQNPNPDVSRRLDKNLLHNIVLEATRGGNLEVFRRTTSLINGEYSTTEMTAMLSSLFQEAAANDSYLILQHLLVHHSFNEEEFDAGLKKALDEGYSQTVKCLINNARDRNCIKSRKWNRILVEAIYAKHPKLALLITEVFPEEINRPWIEASLVLASGQGHVDLVVRLVEMIQKTNSSAIQQAMHAALTVASRRGKTEIVKFLSPFVSDINGTTNIPQWVKKSRLRKYEKKRSSYNSCFAASLGHSDRFAQGSTPLQEALLSWSQATKDFGTLIELLLDNGADINTWKRDSEAPLHIAVETCPKEIVQLFLNRKSRPRLPKNILEVATGREVDSLPVMDMLSRVGASFEKHSMSKHAVLRSALKFFEEPPKDSFEVSRDYEYGQFRSSKSVDDIVTTGPAAVVKRMLCELPNEQANARQYSFILQLATVAGDQDLIRLLLDRGCDINTIGFYHGSALRCASRIGHSELVKTFLRAVANPNIGTNPDQTPLQAAVSNDHIEIVDLLFAAGAKPSVACNPNNEESSPPDSKWKGPDDSIVRLALENNNIELAKSLVHQGAEVNRNELLPGVKTSLMMAVCHPNGLELVQLLLQKGARVNDKQGDPRHYGSKALTHTYTTALSAACSKGFAQVAKVLLENGADVEMDVELESKYGHWMSPLQLASVAGHVEVVQVLLAAGADLNRSNQTGTALSETGACGSDVEMIHMLLNAGAEISPSGPSSNALAMACKNGRLQMIETLIGRMNHDDLDSKCILEALRLAAEREDDQAFQMMLRFDMCLSEKALSLAAESGFDESVKFLLELGLDPNSSNDFGNMPIQLAAFNQHLSTVKLLLEYGADVNSKSAQYDSPLEAVLYGALLSHFSLCSRNSEPALPRPITRRYGGLIADGGQFGGFRSERGLRDLSYFTTTQDIALLLIENGVRVNEPARKFGTPLHVAARLGNKSVVEAMLDQGAHIDAVGGEFGTPLHAAFKCDDLTVFNLLIERGCDLNLGTPEKKPVLIEACDTANRSAVYTLIEHGADLNIMSPSSKTTPLTTAIQQALKEPHWHSNPPERHRNAEQILKVLLSQGSRLHIQDHNIHAAIDSERKDWTYVEQLLNHCPSYRLPEPLMIEALGKLEIGQSANVGILWQSFCPNGEQSVTESMITAARKPEVLSELLMLPRSFTISQETLICMGQRRSHGRRFMRMLLEAEPSILVTEALVLVALRAYPDTAFAEAKSGSLHLILTRSPELEATGNMLDAAPFLQDYNILRDFASTELVEQHPFEGEDDSAAWSSDASESDGESEI